MGETMVVEEQRRRSTASRGVGGMWSVTLMGEMGSVGEMGEVAPARVGSVEEVEGLSRRR